MPPSGRPRSLYSDMDPDGLGDAVPRTAKLAIYRKKVETLGIEPTRCSHRVRGLDW
jgi:hypothetical protein